MSEIRAKKCSWLVLSLLASSFSAATCSGIPEGSADCVAQISRLQHRWDRKQSQLKVEKDELTKELEDCRAAEMACGTREDLCKHKLGTLEDTVRVSPDKTILDLERKVQQCERGLETTTDRAVELQNQTRILELRLDGLQTKLSLENRASKSCQDELQMLQYEKDACQASRQSLLAKLETSKDEIAEQQRHCESKQETARQTISDLTGQHQAELEAMRLEAKSTIIHFRTEVGSLTQKHAIETLRVREEVTAKMEKEMTQRERQLLSERWSLQIVIRQLHADLSEGDRILQAVKDELFTVRRELFDLKEIHVRGPERRRRLRIQWWKNWQLRFLQNWKILVQAGDEVLLHPVRCAWGRVLALHDKYLKPVWRSLKNLLEPVCSSVYAVGLKVWVRFAAVLRKFYPIVLRYAEVTWSKVSKVIRLTWLVLMQKSSYWWSRCFEQMRLIAMWTLLSISSVWDQVILHIVAWRQRVSWSQISQSAGNLAHDAYLVAKGLRTDLSLVAVGLKVEIRELLHRYMTEISMVAKQARQVVAEKYEQDIQPRLYASLKSIPPLVENVALMYRQHLEPHVHALYNLVLKHVQPFLGNLVEGYRRFHAAAADALGVVADVAIGNVRVHPFLNVLTRYFEWVKSHSTEIVYHSELMVLVVVITGMLMRPCRRKIALLSTSVSGKKKRPSSKLMMNSDRASSH